MRSKAIFKNCSFRSSMLKEVSITISFKSINANRFESIIAFPFLKKFSRLLVPFSEYLAK